MNDRKDVFGNLIIDRFRNDYEAFSNFALGAPFTLWGVDFSTSEHAYVWSKTHDPLEKEEILRHVTYVDFNHEDGTVVTEKFIGGLTTPGVAKARGKTVTLRPDWEEVRYDIMLEILEAKFSQNWGFLQVLLQTEDAILIEGNTWHDNIWGSCICERCGDKGQNLLGKALMQVRAKLAARFGNK